MIHGHNGNATLNISLVLNPYHYLFMQQLMYMIYRNYLNLKIILVFKPFPMTKALHSVYLHHVMSKS